ncbi:MAG: DUF1588 domain-containing protein [Myxococcota bacterium]
MFNRIRVETTCPAHPPRSARWLLGLGLATALATGGCKDEPGSPQEEDPGVDDPPASEIVGPSEALVKKLRSWEYRNTIASLLGDAITVNPQHLPTDLVRANFSSISASLDCYGDIEVEAFETAAFDIAQQAFAASPDPLEAAGCAPAAATDPCVETFLADFGRSAWRRPMTEDERVKYVSLADEITTIEQGDVLAGVEATVAAILQSPYFLYRVELGEGLSDDPTIRKYTPFEMATRLAYTLWETTPDEYLLDAAEAGELRTEESVREYATVMLEHPRAAGVLQRFWREHLSIDRLTFDDYPKPGATEQLYADMRLEGQYLAARVSEPGANALEFLTGKEAFLTPSLAAHYGVDDVPAEPQWVTLPASRQGYLSSGLFLAANSHPDKTSPTRRGKFVVERIMCRIVQPPPADVDLELPEVEAGVTRREQLEMHSSEPACAGCHQVLDPPGFAFEGFDPVGAPRDTDNGLPLNTSGTIEGQAFDGAPDLLSILVASEAVPECLTRQAFRNTLGQLETSDQEAMIEELNSKFVQSDHEFRSLIVDIVSSQAYRFARSSDDTTAP